MFRLRQLLLIPLLLLCAVLPAQAERLVSTVSRSEVAITSSFSGDVRPSSAGIGPKAA